MFARINYVYTILLLPPLFFAAYSSARFVEVINQTQFTDEVLKNNGPTVVEFSASWCSVCQTVKQPFEQIAIDPEFNRVTFARVDIDQHPVLSKKNNIVGVPTFLYLENGKMVNQEVGVESMNNFDNSLRTNIRTHFKLAQSDMSGDETVQDVISIAPDENPMPFQEGEMHISEATAEPMGGETQMMPEDEMIQVEETDLSAPSSEDTLIQPEMATITVEEEPAETSGLINGVQAFFMAIINGIIGFFTTIINAIKGLFGR